MPDVLQLGRLLVFLVFLALGIVAARSKTRERISAFIACTLAVTLLAGFFQRESWPFTTWALFHHLSPPQFGGLVFEFVDDAGNIHPADARMWEPTSDADVQAWMNGGFQRLSPAGRADLLHGVLGRAERARRRLVATGRAPNEWLLDGLAAPYHFLRPRPWTDAPAARAFVGVRVVRIRWNVEELAHDSHAQQREVVDQFNER